MLYYVLQAVSLVPVYGLVHRRVWVEDVNSRFRVGSMFSSALRETFGFVFWCLCQVCAAIVEGYQQIRDSDLRKATWDTVRTLYHENAEDARRTLYELRSAPWAEEMRLRWRLTRNYVARNGFLLGLAFLLVAAGLRQLQREQRMEVERFASWRELTLYFDVPEYLLRPRNEYGSNAFDEPVASAVLISGDAATIDWVEGVSSVQAEASAPSTEASNAEATVASLEIGDAAETVVQSQVVYPSSGNVVQVDAEPASAPVEAGLLGGDDTKKPAGGRRAILSEQKSRRGPSWLDWCGGCRQRHCCAHS